MTADAAASRVGLVVEGLTVRYGGVTAVDEVSLHAPTGRITGLIGPNGAGKTTLFNACSGLVRPAAGRVFLFGDDATDLSPPARARRGLGRTFQRFALFDSRTVGENIALAREALLAGGSPWKQWFARPSERADVRAAVGEALALCGLENLAKEQAGSLSTGQRRLVELCRVVAAGFPLLLLDEPSSGLDRSETVAFATVLRRLAVERGCGILLVEHDMALVMEVCEHLWVLDFGSLIFDGNAAEVSASDTVRKAYLGTEAA